MTQRSKPLSGFQWRRLGIVAALGFVLVFAFTIWQRDVVMQWVLLRLLQHAPVDHPALSGVRFDASQARLSTVQFTLQTGNGPLVVQLQGVQMDYRLKQAMLQSIHAEKARLRFEFVSDPTAKNSDDAMLTMPILPLENIAVDALDLEVHTPQGAIRFNGRADLKVDADQAWLLTLEEHGDLIQAKLPRDLKLLQISAQQSSGIKIWDAQLVRRDQQHWQCELSADAVGLLNWLKYAELIPTNLRQEIATSVVMAGNADITGMQLNLSAHSADNLQNISGRALLTRHQAYLASAELAIKPDNGYINLDGHLDLPAAEFFALLKPWTPDIIDAWQFPAGNVMGNARLTMRPKQRLTGEIYIKAHGVALGAGPVRAEDSYFSLEVKTLSPLAVAFEMDAPTVFLGKDAKINQLQLKAGLKNNTLSLTRATLPMLGGMLEILPARLNIKQLLADLTLGVRNIDLARLLGSLNYPELSGTGSISGKLPLRLSPESIEVVDGKLHANQPGVLRYQGPQAAGDNLAFKALSNLRYEKLQATLNYRPSGDYQVGLRLEGKNPELFSGHPIAFNLNLHGHLPDLLQKGIMAGDFEKPILEQIKSADQ